MGELVAKPSLTDRMVRAARLETSLYNEVEADLSATNQALTVGCEDFTYAVGVHTPESRENR